MEVHLQGSADWKGLMYAMTANAFEFNLQTVRLEVNAPALHEEYHGQWDRFEKPNEDISLWRVEIPLFIRGQTVGRVQVAGYPDFEPIWEKIAAIMNVIQDFEASVTASSEKVPPGIHVAGEQRLTKIKLEPEDYMMNPRAEHIGRSFPAR
jgi:UDP-GlcNAc:undecaprenyl-phosphate GlcNAc-1-phosphate transferase